MYRIFPKYENLCLLFDINLIVSDVFLLSIIFYLCYIKKFGDFLNTSLFKFYIK